MTAPPVVLGFTTITAERYRARAATRAALLDDHPWLVDEWFVDVARRR